ncbi:ferredoxin [Sinorhizobium glycinis]|uniref:Ferredoxin n=1 Tax=Sinorhizobium glycinis TaxID=1472378 RepID=A0A178XIV5_9HYPH|nr:four-helix bundle copper-binding protein [Sinorhizobium glycinis]OAP35179.1 ferredoxin [Sinorhizobium glycinis]
MHNHQSPEMKACIDECLACYRECVSTAMGHCLETGGEHTKPEHFRLVTVCAEICRTSAHFMLVGSEHHMHVCRECAEICSQCADDCERIGDMQSCVDACRRCADSCLKMAA